MITTTKISKMQKSALLAKNENHFFDAKSIQITPAKLTKTLAAFANADGGELFVGIAENESKTLKFWRGFENEEAANGHIQALENFFPLGADFSYEFLSIEESSGLVLKIEIKKTKDIKKSSDGKVYVRRGAQNLPVDTHEALKTLEFSKGIHSFEDEVVKASHEVVSNSTVIIEYMINVVPTGEPFSWLKKQQLIFGDMPTAAAILLFAEEPQALLPKRCGIKIYRYKTNAKDGTRASMAFDPISIEGHIYDQIYRAVEITKKVIEDSKISGDEGLEDINYPPEAIHEIIANAALHRDYSLTDDIHIRIFDNRLEIESPGRFPAHINPENILKERFARNPRVVRLINKFPNPPNKDVGEGLNTAFQMMRSLKLKDPILSQNENSVLVTVKHEPLASPEELILEYLKDHPNISNGKAREVCFIGSENKMKRILQAMVKKNILETVPHLGGSKTAYMKKK